MAKKKNILRLFGTDIPGDMDMKNGLRRVKGISFNTAQAILKKADIDPDKHAGEISDEESDRIQEVIENAELPEHILNRRVDPETGDEKLMVSTDLEIQKRQDIDRLKKLGSYRGMRHRRGLPVRGQKTQSSFRGKTSVGVSRERIKKEGGEGEE
jgi:small subunit ribosomal protein S13